MKKSHPNTLTDAPRLFEIATWAVYSLGGTGRAVDTEDAAIKCHQLAPTVFAWQKHKDQVNLELVRVSLSDAKKSKNGGLLSGSGREGWRLSSRGLDWVRNREKAGQTPPGVNTRHPSSKAGSIDSVRRERERERLLTSDAWRSWIANGAVEPKAAQQIFRIDEYTSNRMAAIKVARLRAMFNADDELTGFLATASEVILRQGEANDG